MSQTDEASLTDKHRTNKLQHEKADGSLNDVKTTTSQYRHEISLANRNNVKQNVMQTCQTEL